MNISFKNMLASFVMGIVLFSLIMLCICNGFFNSTVKVKERPVDAKDEYGEPIVLSDTIVFQIADAEDDGILAVLAILDDNSQKMFFTPIYSDLLVPYKESFSYASTLFDEMEKDALISIIKTFSGVSVEKNDFEVIENVSDIIELKDEIGRSGYSKYELFEFPLALKLRVAEDTREHMKIVDIDATVNKYKHLLGIK